MPAGNEDAIGRDKPKLAWSGTRKPEHSATRTRKQDNDVLAVVSCRRTGNGIELGELARNTESIIILATVA